MKWKCKYLVLKNIIEDYEVKLETGIKKEIQDILNYEKNKILAKIYGIKRWYILKFLQKNIT